MSFPVDAVTQILGHGFLKIRENAAAGLCLECGLEANHLHNLPHALATQSAQLLRFYYEVERPEYLGQIGGTPPSVYLRHWEVIKEYLGTGTNRADR